MPYAIIGASAFDVGGDALDRAKRTVVKRWTNFADRRDPVALDVHLADDYAPNDRGVQVKDDLVVNGYSNRAGKANYHKMYGYPRAPELSEIVRAFL